MCSQNKHLPFKLTQIELSRGTSNFGLVFPVTPGQVSGEHMGRLPISSSLNCVCLPSWCTEFYYVQFNTVQLLRRLQLFWPHESGHIRPPCPSPSPGGHTDSHPSSPWCHPAISSSVVPFSSCPQSLPASESFPMSQLFAWGGQNTGVSVSASFPPKKSQGWSP